MRPSFVAASEDTQTRPYPLSHLLYIHKRSLSVSHSSLFTLQTHCRREYTSSSTARRPSIGSDPLPPLLLLLPCLPSSTLSGLLPHLPFPGSTKHDLMI